VRKEGEGEQSLKELDFTTMDPPCGANKYKTNSGCNKVYLRGGVGYQLPTETKYLSEFWREYWQMWRKNSSKPIQFSTNIFSAKLGGKEAETEEIPVLQLTYFQIFVSHLVKGPKKLIGYLF
jgi:hypothetical protein